ncbi:hypothetical protein [Methanoculleus sp.]|uniref:hypothetical protein n=1 Tax=Methanoculleus sp. TaxID=90427 RepID=UPI0025CDCEE3|nr:hypothetical protein [Methanoculleus sp.]
MSAVQMYLLPVITLFSGALIIISFLGYVKLNFWKRSDPSVNPKESTLKPLIILAIVAIASIPVLLGWHLYYMSCIGNLESIQDVETFCTAQTATITDWLILLLDGQFGSAVVVISLLAVVMKLTTSAYSIRVLNVIFSPVHGRRWILGVGAAVYILAIAQNLALILALSFQVLELPDLRTFWGYPAVLSHLILCVIAFMALFLFFIHVLNTRHSDHIIQKTLDQVSILNASGGGKSQEEQEEGKEGAGKLSKADREHLQLVFNVINSSIQQSDIHSAKNSIGQLSEKVKIRIKSPGGTGHSAGPSNWKERLLVFKGKNSASMPAPSDNMADGGKNEESRAIYPPETGYTTELDKTVRLVNFYATQMVNSAKVALLRGDEKTAYYIVSAIDKSILDKYKDDQFFTRLASKRRTKKETAKLEEYFINQMGYLIDSYSALGQFSVERGHTNTALNCVDSLSLCNETLFKPYTSGVFKLTRLPDDAADEPGKGPRPKPNPPGTANFDRDAIPGDSKGRNLYDLSIECVKSASIVSQIAAQKNYGTLMEDIAEELDQMHKAQCRFLTRKYQKIPPYLFIKYYIWAIKDAGVSAANNNLEWVAIRYIKCLQEYGKGIYSMIECYDKNGVSNIAKLLTHISSSIREIGQILADRRFQMGTNEAVVAIGRLGGLVLGDERELFKDGGKNEDPRPINKDNLMLAWTPNEKSATEKEKLAIVRIILNLKDLGCSAAEKRIEKGVIRTVEQLLYLHRTSQVSATLKEEPSRKVETLSRIGENFYEIAMKTRQQDLQEGLIQIIRHDVCCIAELDKGSRLGDDHIQDEVNREYIRDIFLKTFAALAPVDNTSEKAVTAYLKSIAFSREEQFGEDYSSDIEQVAPRILKYYANGSNRGFIQS